MANSASIKVGQSQGFSWIKINGRGDVFTTPSVKDFIDSVLQKPSVQSGSAPTFVIDMEECTGMDSTFLGMLAGLAIKLQKFKDSCLMLRSVDKHNIDSLEELGIDSLVEINPEDKEINENYEEVKDNLSELSSKDSGLPSPKLILETHQSLGSLNEENEKEFSSVIDTFKSQIEG